jgi:hypothetical protein
MRSPTLPVWGHCLNKIRANKFKEGDTKNGICICSTYATRDEQGRN